MAMAVTPVQRILAIVVLALLAAPSAHAAWGTTLEANSATFGPGSKGDLEPLFFSVEQSLRTAATTPADFHLDAEKARVEVDHATAARAGSIDPFIPDNTTQNEYEGATIQGLENRDGYRLMVIPGQETRLEVQSSCATAANSEQERIEREPLAADPGERPPVQTDVSGSHAWQGCGSTELVFLDDFTVALWEWDFEVTDASGTEPYTTGHIQHEATTGLPTDAVGRQREAWITVEDGRLEITLERESPHYLYAARGSRMETESGILFQQAQMLDTELHSQELQGEIYLQGSLDTTLDTNSIALTADVRGRLTGITVNKEALALPAAITNAAPGGTAWMPPPESAWLLLLIPLVIQAWLMRRPVRLHDEEKRRGLFICDPPAKTLRQRRAAGRVLMARRHIELEQPRRALWQVRGARATDPSHDEVILIRAEACTRLARRGGRGRKRLLKMAHRHLEAFKQRTVAEPLLARYFCAVGDLSWETGNASKAEDMILTGFLYDNEYTRRFYHRLPYKDSISLESTIDSPTLDVT